MLGQQLAQLHSVLLYVSKGHRPWLLLTLQQQLQLLHHLLTQSYVGHGNSKLDPKITG